METSGRSTLYAEQLLGGGTEYLKELEVVQKKYLKGGCAVIVSCLSMCMYMNNL